jgi:hypothetical protein
LHILCSAWAPGLFVIKIKVRNTLMRKNWVNLFLNHRSIEVLLHVVGAHCFCCERKWSKTCCSSQNIFEEHQRQMVSQVPICLTDTPLTFPGCKLVVPFSCGCTSAWEYVHYNLSDAAFS